MNLQVQEGDIVGFIRKVKEAFNEFACEHSIKYEFTSEFNSLSCWFDPDMIEKIFFNLLSNAFKFTSDHGSISITLYLVKDNSLPPFSVDEIDSVIPTEAVEIVVEDTGIGIPPERINKIFDRFYQISDDNGMQKALENKGTGIGLALTKDLVSLHHGKIRVDSLEGKGSRFTVTIPIGKEHFEVHELAEKPRITPAVFTHDNYADLESERAELSHDLSDKQEKQQFGTEGAPPEILIVEDNIELRNYLKSNLEPEYKVLEAENGNMGLKIALDKIPDLIIGDVMMHGMDGLEMSRKLKEDNNTCHIPIIILTAKGAEESRVEGLETGVDDYITKPFNQKELEIKIRNLINIRKTLHEKFRKDIILEPSEVTVTSFDEKFLVKAMEVVEENISDGSFDVTRFVSEMGMSRSVLYRKLRAITNQSANEFINTIRLKRAAQLLSQNKLTVSEVTYQVGYNDPQYFSKCFSKFFGKSPSQYAADFKDKQPENKSTESLL
jgi:CheY-like chemotaxis protein